MNIRHLQTFVQVAKVQSFSKAAKQLGYSQAAITIQIQQLEEELHTHLFERFHKTISLSEKGILFLDHALQILQAINNAKKSVCDTCIVEGTLRIGTIESLCTSLFPSLLQTYHNNYPNVRIIITTGSPQELLDQLDHNQLDMVYMLDEQRFHNNWINIIKEKEEVVFVCSKHHPICEKKDLTLQDILQEELILTEKNASYRAAFEHNIKQDIALQPVIEIGNTDFIITMIQTQFGISLLPRVAVNPYIERQELVLLEPKDIKIEIWRQLIYHKHKWLNPQMQAFIELVKVM